MDLLSKIRLLLKHIDSDNSIHDNYKIINGRLFHMHYGINPTYIKEIVGDELYQILDNVELEYANQMRVSKRIIKNSWNNKERFNHEIRN